VVVGCQIFIGKCMGELEGFGGESSNKSSKNHGGVESASSSGEMM
jgi:hypothetical protein